MIDQTVLPLDSLCMVIYKGQATIANQDYMVLVNMPRGTGSLLCNVVQMREGPRHLCWLESNVFPALERDFEC
jgi:hypothetical protein